MYGQKDIGQIKDQDIFLFKDTGKRKVEAGLGYLETGNK